MSYHVRSVVGRVLVVSTLLIGLVLSIRPTSVARAAATDLSNNLSSPVASIASSSLSIWNAQSFTTTATHHYLTDVRLPLCKTTANPSGTVFVYVYSVNGSNQPGARLATIASPSINSLSLYNASPCPVVDLPVSPSIELAAATAYYLVVTTSNTDIVNWDYASSTAGTGFPSNYTYSADGGTTWSVAATTAPQKMQVVASDAPATLTTTTTLTSAPNPSAYGQAVTFTTIVTSTVGTPTGSVTVTIDSSALNVPLDVTGSAAYVTNTLAVGDHPITAVYSGDANYTPSASSTYTHTVTCLSAITVTNAADNGPGSLRDAIGLVCPDGTITFDGDYTIGLTAGQLVIDKSLTIDGTGHSIVLDGQSASRVIYVNAGVTFALRHAAVINGSALDGGGLYNNGATVTLREMQLGDNHASQSGGGLFNDGGTLILTDTLFISNTASQLGGGLYHWGSPLTVSQTQFVNNSAGLYGGGAYVAWGTALLTQTQFLTNTASMDGGGLYAVSAGLLLDQSQISGNSADYSGGGVSLIAAMGRAPNRVDDLPPNTAIIQDTVFQHNTANWGAGGGLYNGDVFSTSVARSTFTANRALCGGGCGGGGIFNAGQIALDTVALANNLVDGGEGPGVGGGLQSALFSTVSMINSTVNGNTATDLGGGQGGGLAVAGDANLENSTIHGNTAGTGGGLYYSGLPTLNNVTVAGNTGGGVVAEECVECNPPIFTARNTLIADNQLANGTPLDCVGELNSQGYNLVETTDQCTLSGDLTGVLTGVDPVLGLLQGNGGATWTMALLSGSPALEAGNPAVPGSGGAACAATDQRGVSRPQGAVCDIGAFEAQGNFIKTVDVTVAQAGQRATYTLVVQAIAPIVNGAISDTLPADVTLAGPITLEPVGAGTIGTLPTLVTDLNLAVDEVVTITVPITVNAGVLNGALITNVATLTADELSPLNASATFEVDTFDLSSSIKRVDRSTAMWGDYLAYTITLTNTALYKTSAFTVTDALPAYTNYIAGSASATVGSTVFMGSPTGGALIWTGALSGTVGAPGYVYGDSSGGGELSGVSYNWIEITPTGTLLDLADQFGSNPDEGYSPPITLPFPVTFYDTAYDVLTVSANGAIYFENSSLGWENTPIPADTTYGLNRYIAPFWTDLTLGGGAVYYEVQGVAPHRQVVIEFWQVSAFSSLGAGLTEPGTFEVVVYEDRPDILFQYQDVNFNDVGRDSGADATVGIQDSITQGVQYSYNTPALSNGLAIVFAPPPAQNAVAELTFKAIVTMSAPNGTWITNTAVVQDNYGDEWSLSATTLLGTPADVSIAKTVTPTVAQPGQAITYTLSVSNVGGLTASGVVLTDEIPISLTGVAVQSAGIVITQTGGINYVWQVNDLAPGASGFITLTGVISPDIQGVAGFTNTATISAVADGNLADNTSSAWVALLYNLTVATVGDGTVSPTTNSYPYGTVVPITATANVGSSFVGWSGDLSGNTNPTSILIDGDKSITATFDLNQYTLTVATVGNGTVSPTTSSYPYGTLVPVTATANVGSSFIGWSGDLSGNTNPTSILIDGDKSITATFDLNQYTLTVATVGNGTVSPTTSSYAYGTNVPVTATANVGSSFVGWSGDLSGNTNPTSILIDGNKSITATFALNTYTLTVAIVGNGSVSPITSVYAYGTVVPITATAGVGSSFVGWSGDLSGNTNPTSILIDGDKAITATFDLNQYTLTVVTVGNGTVSPTTSSYAYGTNVPVTATAGVGSSFAGWSGDLSGNTSPTSILIDGDKSITATFDLNQYTLTVATVGNGTVSPTTNVYAYGTNVPVTATANVGSSFVGWSGDLSGNTNPTSILIDGDKSITATFDLNQYTLTVATVGDGTVSPTTNSYPYGTVVPITATANVGSSFVDWSGDLSGSANPTSILIDGDKSITATFDLNQYTLTVATVGNGTVSPTTNSYPYGTAVPITATANVGSAFISWSGDLSGNTNPTSILIDGDKSITATFDLNQYTLTVATVGNGTVSPTTSSYTYGTLVPITATAGVGSSFAGWSGDLSGSTNPTSILIDGDKSITATFDLNQYTLTVATVGDGTVSPTTSSYAYGTSVPVTATANVGSAFVGWSGDLSGNTNPTSILIDGDKSITATFDLNQYTLTVATVGNGTVSPTTSSYAYGTVVPITATANVGSSFIGWSGDLSGNTNPTSILIDGDKSITATFDLNQYTLTVATVGNGTVSPTTSSYTYGTVVPITATAGVGSSFVGWSGDLSGSINPTSILIDGDKSITATFDLNQYTLTVATVGDGTVSPTTNSYAYGTLVPITATANVGSAFISWSGDLSGNTNPTSILIDGDKAVTATFSANAYTLVVNVVGPGIVSPTTGAYIYGTVVPVTATANDNAAFVGWSGDLSGVANPTSILIDGDKTITATFEQVEFVTYLPLIAHNAARLPDLIVQSVAASSDVITVVIKNIGDAPAIEAFWVDAYINPTPPPTTVNEIWWDLDRSHEGVAWGVVEPIMPGAVITLTSNGNYVSPDRTYFTGNLPVGTPIYAQVDAYNASTNYGAVLEIHEYLNGFYNNILGPVYSTAGASSALGRFQPIGPQLNPALPDRPVRP